MSFCAVAVCVANVNAAAVAAGETPSAVTRALAPMSITGPFPLTSPENLLFNIAINS